MKTDIPALSVKYWKIFKINERQSCSLQKLKKKQIQANNKFKIIQIIQNSTYIFIPLLFWEYFRWRYFIKHIFQKSDLKWNKNIKKINKKLNQNDLKTAADNTLEISVFVCQFSDFIQLISEFKRIEGLWISFPFLPVIHINNRRENAIAFTKELEVKEYINLFWRHFHK